NNAAAEFTYTNPSPGAPTTFKMNIRERLYTVDRVVLSEAAMTEDELNAITPQTVGVRPAAYPDLTGGTLTYDAVTDATGYNILRGTSASGPFAAVPGGTNVTDTTFTDDSLTAANTGQTFYYVVEAIKPTGNVQSAPVSYVAGSGLIATHYETRFFQDNPGSDNDPILRTDNTLDQNWGSNGPDFLEADPSSTDPDDTWSIIFNCRLRPNTTGDYTFYTASDDGIEMQLIDPATGNVVLSGPNGGIQF